MDDFLQACADGDVDRLKALATDDVYVVVDGEQHVFGPLHLAASLGHTEVCRYLVEQLGFDVDGADLAGGITPLSCAQTHGQDSVAEYLIEAGADAGSSRTNKMKRGSRVPLCAMMYSGLQQHLEDTKGDHYEYVYGLQGDHEIEIEDRDRYLEKAEQKNRKLEVELREVQRRLEREEEKGQRLENEVERQHRHIMDLIRSPNL